MGGSLIETTAASSQRVDPQLRIIMVGVVAALLLSACSTPVRGDNDASSEFQEKILDDGTVSPTEMERAALAFTSCVRNLGGIDVIVSFGEGSNVTRSFHSWRPGASGLPQGDIDDCDSEYFGDVEKAWVLQEQRSPSEERQLYERAVACVRSAGIEVEDSEPSTLTQLAKEHADVYFACLESEFNAAD